MTEILLEKYLASQFKFGFELEAFLKDGYTDVDYDADNYVEGVVTEIIASDFNFKEDEIEIKGDGSLSPDENDDYAFEWATPIMTFTPANLSRCINGLDTVLNSEGIYTNDTCGFHIHLSFPNMSDEDIIWVLSQLAVDNEFLSRLTYFKGIEFLDEEYANIDFIEDIGDYIKSGMYSYIARYFTTEKYRAFHIHSQGTLEWRGPRNFLNRKDVTMIKDFFKLLYDFVMWISKATIAKSINGVSKENYFKLVFGESHKMGDTIITDFATKRSKKIKNKISGIIRNNNYQTLIRLIKKYQTNKDENINKIIDTYIGLLMGYHFHNSDEFLAKILDDLYNQKDEESLGFLLNKLYGKHQTKNIILQTEYSTYEYLMTILLQVKHEETVLNLKQTMASYYSDAKFFNKMMKFLSTHKNLFNTVDWHNIFNNNKILIKYNKLIDNPNMIDSNGLRRYMSSIISRSIERETYLDNRELYQSKDLDWVMINCLIKETKNNIVLFSIVEDVLKSIENIDIDTEYYKLIKNEATLLLQKMYN